MLLQGWRPQDGSPCSAWNQGCRQPPPGAIEGAQSKLLLTRTSLRHRFTSEFTGGIRVSNALQDMAGQARRVAFVTNKHRVVALLTAAVITLLCAAGMSLYTDRYEARARVHVDTQTVLKPMMASLTYQPDIDQQVGMLARTLISRPNMERLVDMPEVGLATSDRGAARGAGVRPDEGHQDRAHRHREHLRHLLPRQQSAAGAAAGAGHAGDVCPVVDPGEAPRCRGCRQVHRGTDPHPRDQAHRGRGKPEAVPHPQLRGVGRV